jgi:hypothetical protein
MEHDQNGRDAAAGLDAFELLLATRRLQISQWCIHARNPSARRRLDPERIGSSSSMTPSV